MKTILKSRQNYSTVISFMGVADQEKILALLASWSFDQKPTAQRGNFSIEKVLSITKKRL